MPLPVGGGGSLLTSTPPLLSQLALARKLMAAVIKNTAELAALDRPELSIDTDDIHAIFTEIKARAPEMLHPNSNAIQRKPWGSQEFAVLDPTTVCVVFRQWA